MPNRGLREDSEGVCIDDFTKQQQNQKSNSKRIRSGAQEDVEARPEESIAQHSTNLGAESL